MIAIEPLMAIAAMATWLIIAVFFRYSSLAAIVCAIFAPFFYVFGGNLAWTAYPPLTIVLVIIALFLLYRHRANISRLLAGTEPRLGSKKKTR